MSRKTPRKETKGRKKQTSSQHTPKRTTSHPLYGQIPLVEMNDVFLCDPDFQPELPEKAIRGNVHRQAFCSWCHFPKYFYVDEEKQCLDCGEAFLFSAEEQKYWYERLQFNFYSKPIHCPACRHKRRDERALRMEMTEATNATKEKPNDAEGWLHLAEVTYQYFQYFGEGNLNQAIFATRQALRLSPRMSGALYWEAACQDGAGYFRRARDNYQKFLLVPSHDKQDKSLKRRAAQRLAELAEFVEDEQASA